MKAFHKFRTYFLSLIIKCWHYVLPEPTYAEWLFLQDENELRHEQA
jgi:hypothetical protein